MAASAILLDLLNLKSRRNMLTTQQMLISKQSEDYGKLAAKWAKTDSNAQELIDKVMYGNEDIKFRGNTYTAGSEYYAKKYVYDKLGYEYDQIEYNMEYFGELYNEFDSIKTENEAQLTDLDTNIKTLNEQLGKECSDTHMITGG